MNEKRKKKGKYTSSNVWKGFGENIKANKKMK